MTVQASICSINYTKFNDFHVNIYNRYKTTDISCTSSLGNVTSIDVRIGGDNAWLLTSLQVIDWTNRRAVKFECNSWFEGGVDPRSDSVVSKTLQNPTLGN